MKKLLRIQFFSSQSDNRESKICGERSRIIQNLKLVRLFAVCAMLFALCYSASAQQSKKVPRVAFLSLPSSGPDLRSEAFRQGLRDFGYMEGQNIVVEYRWADGRTERLAGLAAELVGMKPDVIVTASTFAAQAVKKATTTIPVVVSGVADAVGRGLVASLARPGGNLTGTTLITPDLMGKQLELLKEIVPRITRVAVLGTTPNPTSGSDLRATKEAARIRGLQLQVVEVGGPEEFGSAFSEFAKGAAEGCWVWAVLSCLITVNTSRTSRLNTGSPQCSGRRNTHRRERSWPMGRHLRRPFGAQLTSWIESSKAPSLPICR